VELHLSAPAQVILDKEAIYPDRIRRDALTEADQALGYEAGRINYFNMGLTNIAHTRVEAYDVSADYQWTTSYGVFHVDAAATNQTHFEKQLLSTTPVTEYKGFLDGPLKLRGNAGVTWERGMWTVGWNSQYYDPFLIYGATAIPFLRDMGILNQGGNRYMPRQIYHDMSFKYRVDEAPLWGGIFAHTDFLLAISNVFDRSPPSALYSVIVPASVPSPTLYSDPRLRRYSISVRKSFQ
jgi:hypothetical protein